MAATAVVVAAIPSIRSLETCSCSSAAVPEASLEIGRFSALSSLPSLRLSVSHASGRAASNSNRIRSQISSSVIDSNSRRRRSMAAAQDSTAESVVATEGLLPKTASPLKMTYLEGNSWIWEVVGLKILVDPVLVGNLDFGIPWLYDGAKIAYKDFKLEDLPELDCLLITQGYDDHCHEKTLGPLSRFDARFARGLLTERAEHAQQVTYLEPTGETTILKGTNGSDVVIRASPGPILGPPWQRPESGYFIEVKEPKFSIYHEPHCIFENAKFENEHVDVLVTPVIKQVLPKYTLVSGQEDAVKVAEWLKPRFVVTMKNGDLKTTGILSKIVRTEGTTESFQELLAKKLPNVQVLQPVPAVPLEIPVA